jgi:hypothetical protein
MPLPIHVDAYSGYKANERPRQFCLDEEVREIDAVEARWYSPGAAFFRVRTSASGTRYVLRLDEVQGEWTLQSDLDGVELFGRRSIELVTVAPEAIRRAERRFLGEQSPAR